METFPEKYEFDRPKKALNVEIVYLDEAYTDSPEIQRILDVASWKTIYQENILRVKGRNIFIPMNEPDDVYDTFQLSGCVFDSFEVNDSGIVERDSSRMILPPNPGNFAEGRESMHSNYSVHKGKIVDNISKYAPNGAYTEEDALDKFNMTSKVFQAVEEEGRPFIVPKPVLIGKYPDLLDPHGNPLHFIVFGVPNSGERMDDMYSRIRADYLQVVQEELSLKGGKSVDIGKYMGAFLSETGRFVTIAGRHAVLQLRRMHELGNGTKGYTHHQPTYGNIDILPDGRTVFFADFGTARSLKPLNNFEAKMAKTLDLMYLFLGGSAILDSIAPFLSISKLDSQTQDIINSNIQLYKLQLLATIIGVYSGMKGNEPIEFENKDITRILSYGNVTEINKIFRKYIKF